MTTALLHRLIKRLNKIDPDSNDWRAFTHRYETHAPHLRALLFSLYGHRDDFEARYEDILATTARAWLERVADLKSLDAEREANPRWFQSEHMIGGIAYVDLFAGNLDSIRHKLPYFQEMGLTYLHLMPLFKAPEDNSDGGYAVSSYREVNPKLGTMQQLRYLAHELRQNGISLCLDFIFNHTSDEHAWAQKAIAGDRIYRDYFHILPRSEADKYDRHLREIFPDQHPGAFTPLSRWTHIAEERKSGGAEYSDAPLPLRTPAQDEWVWTTFNSFQWATQTCNA